MTENTETQSTEMADYEDELARAAKEGSAMESHVAQSSRIKVSGRDLFFNGDELPQPLEVVVLTSVLENVYYEGDYDPDNIELPTCFALGHADSDLVPHDNSANKQSESCATCYANKFRSAKKGKGKLCNNKRRLAIVTAQQVEDPSVGTDALQVAELRVSPTSVTPWGVYVQKVAGLANLPLAGVVTGLELVPVQGTSYSKLKPTMLRKVSREQYMKIRPLIQLASADLTKPYEKPQEIGSEQPATNMPGKRSKKY